MYSVQRNCHSINHRCIGASRDYHYHFKRFEFTVPVSVNIIIGVSVNKPSLCVVYKNLSSGSSMTWENGRQAVIKGQHPQLLIPVWTLIIHHARSKCNQLHTMHKHSWLTKSLKVTPHSTLGWASLRITMLIQGSLSTLFHKVRTFIQSKGLRSASDRLNLLTLVPKYSAAPVHIMACW